jgi:hypothetical protein
MQCFAYFLVRFDPAWMDLPFLARYEADGSHGLKYVFPPGRIPPKHNNPSAAPKK